MANVTNPESYDIVPYDLGFCGAIEDSDAHQSHQEIEIAQLKSKDMLILGERMNRRMSNLIGHKIFWG